MVEFLTSKIKRGGGERPNQDDDESSRNAESKKQKQKPHFVYAELIESD